MARQVSIKSKFLVFSVILFLIMFIVGNIAFVISMQGIAQTSKGNELRQLVDVERIKLESSVKGEIAIAIKMAGSPLIQSYFVNPTDPELEKLAFAEIAGYRKAFAGNSVFWVNDIDKKFYSDSAYAFTVNPNDPNNYWYKMTLNETDKYNFNINYNPDLKKTMLWINAPVFYNDNKNKPIGILGTGIDLTSFTNSIYQSYTESSSLYFFNSAGEITGAQDASLVANKKNIVDVLGKTGTEVLDRIKKISQTETQNFNTPEGEVAIAMIPALEWYVVASHTMDMHDYLKNNMTVVFSLMMVMVALIFIVFNIFLSRVLKPLKKTVTVLKTASSNFDLTQRIANTSRDEIGEIAYSFNKLIEAFKVPIAEALTVTSTLTSTSDGLSEVSNELSKSSDDMVDQTNVVASTTEQMSVNINTMAGGAEQASSNANEVASAAEQMSFNMNTVAAAIEEMSASIRQIAGNTGEVLKVATDATSKADSATKAMGNLGAAAKEIGQVTDVIKKIADKTNLLALNATIEAASAGEAGKGFAVVAGEIKELANQSAKSADDIAQRIEHIQKGTNDAVNVIHAVSEIIEKINHSVESIAGHVDQQTKASNEISNNVSQANIGAKRVASAISEVAKGTNNVSRNASEAAKGAHNVSQNTLNMNNAAKESARGATQVNNFAKELKKLASDLKSSIVKFKI